MTDESGFQNLNELAAEFPNLGSNDVPRPQKKATWPQAIKTFFFPICLILFIRWAIVEPFVIPTGSMIPTLLVHDHILVQKFEFGLKWPFSHYWIFMWKKPERGQIIVFRYPQNPQIFYIKRLVGLPGDTIQVSRRILKINGVEIKTSPSAKMDLPEDTGMIYDYSQEILGANSHLLRHHQKEDPGMLEQLRTITVPEKSYFMMGDNRDESSDSRVWGFVPEENLVGSPFLILMGCTETLPNSSVCSPKHLLKSRIFKIP